MIKRENAGDAEATWESEGEQGQSPRGKVRAPRKGSGDESGHWGSAPAAGVRQGHSDVTLATWVSTWRL